MKSAKFPFLNEDLLLFQVFCDCKLSNFGFYTAGWTMKKAISSQFFSIFPHFTYQTNNNLKLIGIFIINDNNCWLSFAFYFNNLANTLNWSAWSSATYIFLGINKVAIYLSISLSLFSILNTVTESERTAVNRFSYVHTWWGCLKSFGWFWFTRSTDYMQT